MDSPATNTGREYIRPIPCKNMEVYNELNTLIYEYLEVNGLEQALHTFSKECQSKNLPCPKPVPEGETEVKAAFSHYDGQQLLKSFDEGDLDSFLKLWKQFQTHIQVTSEDMKKLEVYLRVHFAIWPKANDLPEDKQLQAMQKLRSFFEDHSESLSSDATILPLFALPFVSDPRPHPIFKDLFQETWTTKLREQLETTVNKYFELLQENITIHCKLAAAVAKSSSSPSSKLQQSKAYSMPSYSGSGNDTPATRVQSKISSNKSRSLSRSFDKKANEPVAPNSRLGGQGTDATTSTEYSVCYHKDRFFQLLAIHKKLRKVLRGVRENYGKLLKVCSILLNSVENPEGLSLERIIHQCYLTYPDIFTNPSSTSTSSILSSASSKQPDLDHFKRLAKAASTTAFSTDVSDVGLLFLGINDIGLDNLNYDKVKSDLTSERLPPTEKLCLLQALRWLVTKTSPVSRSQVMLHFMENDLFGLSHDGEEVRFKLFSSLLSPAPTYQKESLSRLINAFASTWSGRSYLTSTDHVVTTLIKSLVTFKTQEESFICHMVIATLQKLSLRRDMRLLMIEKNVIPWLVKYIKTELDRDLVREEVGQVLMDEAETLSNNNNDVSYGDTTFNNYLMEYAWALLMNLCLHPESIKSALTVDFEFLHCIVTMLTSKFSPTSNASEFIPYVLSTLFSLLRNPELFDKAKTMKLDKKLGSVIDYQPPEIASHMKHLLDQLYEKENVDRLLALGETEYDDTDNPDPDELETELELQESWMTPKNEVGLLTGDDLLIKDYLFQTDYCPPTSSLQLGDSQANSNDTDASNSVDFSTAFNLGILLRPKTPKHGRTSHTTIMNDSSLKEPPNSTVMQPPPHQQLRTTPQLFRPLTPPQRPRRALPGEGTASRRPKPQVPSNSHQQKIVANHRRESNDQIINQPIQFVTPADPEQPRRELSQHLQTAWPRQQSPPPPQKLQQQLPLPPPSTSHAQRQPPGSPEQRMPTTIRIVETAHDHFKRDSHYGINSIRESPLISFPTNNINTLSSPPPQKQTSILISFLNPDEDTRNNNDNDFFQDEPNLQYSQNEESLI